MDSILNKLSDHEKQALRILFSPELNITPNKRCGFTIRDDTLLKTLVSIYGTTAWEFIQKYFPERKPRQLRERYLHYLAPGIEQKQWTDGEDALLLDMYQKYGPKWLLISKYFNGRSEVNIKNRWVTLLKRTSNSGCDAKVTHSVEQSEEIKIDENKLFPFDSEGEDEQFIYCDFVFEEM